jgi:ubiquinone/menaquinone biosynthesis C-methylase UbiE
MSDLVKDLFDEKAANWSRKYAEGGPLARRRDAITSALASLVTRPAKVLDFGCGTGDVAMQLHTLGYAVSGCDISPQMLAGARERASDIEWLQLTKGRHLPFTESSFDAIVASSVLEYVDDVDALLDEFQRIIRPGGTLLVTVPNPRHPLRRLERLARDLAQLADFNWIQRKNKRIDGFARYLRASQNHFKLERWESLFSAHGFAWKPDSSQTRQPLALLVFCRT